MVVLNQCDIASALNWNRAGVTFGGLSGICLRPHRIQTRESSDHWGERSEPHTCGENGKLSIYMYIMAYGSTPYVGMTPKKNGGHIESYK